MNWKTDLKLSDLDPLTPIEITCKRCGLTHYQSAAAIARIQGLGQAYLDEVEYALCCARRGCKGGIRIALIHDDKNEGFVGGMA